MSEQAKQPVENTELIRDLVDPLKSQVESEDGDRSPTKTEKLKGASAMSEQAKQAGENTELIRDLVDPLKSQVESEDGDRSPTKTERDLIS